MDQKYYENLLRYKCFQGGLVESDSQGRLSGEVLNLPKGNAIIFEGFNDQELFQDFVNTVESYLNA